MGHCLIYGHDRFRPHRPGLPGSHYPFVLDNFLAILSIHYKNCVTAIPARRRLVCFLQK